jgi:NAD(P)-dependent dehydrogenase (short-subunit alcohol dehydrogenase family)
MPDQKGITCVVTGANTGIGRATASALASRGASVVLACRDAEKGHAARAAIRDANPDAQVAVRNLDLASLSNIAAFAERLKDELTHIDVLINNAGVMAPKLDRTEDGFELQFGTNVLGHFALTGHLLPLLEDSTHARVVSLSSLVHWYARLDFTNLNAEKHYGRLNAYGQSKLANLVFAHELQRRLTRSGSTTMSVAAHPGVTKSKLARHSPLVNLAMPLVGQSTEKGALPSLMAATAPGLQGGDYAGPGGLMTTRGAAKVQRSRRLARDEEMGSALWNAAERLTGVRYL